MWTYVNNSLDKQDLLVQESLMTLANGYLGVRGNFEECPWEGSIRGTYINGLYDIVDVKHAENAFGFPQIKEKQPNIIDAQTVLIELDGELVNVFTPRCTRYTRVLDMRDGVQVRTYSYTTQAGKTANITIRRAVSQEFAELFAIELRVQYDGHIRLLSELNGDVRNYVNPNDPRVAHGDAELTQILDRRVEPIEWDGHADGGRCALFMGQILIQTKRSELTACCSTTHSVHGKAVEETSTSENGKIQFFFDGEGDLSLTKYNVYTDSRTHGSAQGAGAARLREVSAISFEELVRSQRSVLDAFWEMSDVEIEGVPELQQGIRFNLFQLLQSVGKDGRRNISAKGLSGEGYEGHYFWDTEVYVLPVFQMTEAPIAKSLLDYRYGTLDQARQRARELGHESGAKYPWRTISGIECSAYFPAGTAQYHINGDIAYGFIQYYLFTGDLEYMLNKGFEVLVETSRLWLELGHYHGDQFRIDNVTGPDEYTAIVNNNWFTNALAKHGLTWTVKLADLLQKEHSAAYKELLERLQLTGQELGKMKRAAEQMWLPHDEKLGIDMQDDTFLQKKKWDFEHTPKDKYPLLLHYHPLTIYRHQVLKQPDTILGHFMLEHLSNEETMKRSYLYYEALTTHDSSLSACVHGIMAARIGELEKAYAYFHETVRLDLDNTHGNTKDGLHIANLGGTWLSVVYGFGGFRLGERGVKLRPKLPASWKRYAFKIQYRGRIIHVDVGQVLTLQLLQGDPVDIEIDDNPVHLTDTVSIPFRG